VYLVCCWSNTWRLLNVENKNNADGDGGLASMSELFGALSDSICTF
jgi:hypothetical protein